MRNNCKHKKEVNLVNREVRWMWCPDCGAMRLDIGYNYRLEWQQNGSAPTWDYKKGKWISPKIAKI